MGWMNETVITAAPPAQTTLSRRPNASFGFSAFFSTALASKTGATGFVSPASAWASSLD